MGRQRCDVDEGCNTYTAAACKDCGLCVPCVLTFAVTLRHHAAKDVKLCPDPQGQKQRVMPAWQGEVPVLDLSEEIGNLGRRT